MRTLTKYLALVSAVGMFVVLVMGATVTNTGSEHGCGKSWPLCHGQLIPQFAVSTFIEFSHRAIVGVESVLVITTAVLAFYLYRDRLEIQILAPVMVLFLFLQAGLGAWAVMAPQLAVVLALHFGVSLVAFASVLLTAVFLFEVDGQDRLRDRPVPQSFRWYSWSLAAYSYVVVYLGAYVRHTHADDACRGWPLCNGRIIPAFGGGQGVAFAHRLAALLLIGAILVLVLWSARLRAGRPDVFRGAVAASVAVFLQAFAGVLVVFTDTDLFAALAHAAFAGILFGSLTYVCVHVLPRSRPPDAGPRSPDPEHGRWEPLGDRVRDAAPV